MVDIQTISVVIAAASVVVGVITFIINSQQEKRQRQIELLFHRTQRDQEDYYKAWGEVTFVQDWTTFEELQERYSFADNLEARARFHFLGSYYNSIGLLLKEKVVDPDFLFSTFAPVGILRTWRRFEPVIKEMRKQANEPILHTGFEYLANEIMKRYPELTPPPIGMSR